MLATDCVKSPRLNGACLISSRSSKRTASTQITVRTIPALTATVISSLSARTAETTAEGMRSLLKASSDNSAPRLNQSKSAICSNYRNKRVGTECDDFSQSGDFFGLITPATNMKSTIAAKSTNQI